MQKHSFCKGRNHREAVDGMWITEERETQPVDDLHPCNH